jgi:hypothetical protein
MKRVGDCCQCSLCCRSLALPIPHPDAARRTPLGLRVPLPLVLNPDVAHFYRMRGLRLTADSVEVPLPVNAPAAVGRLGAFLVVRVPHVCAQLDRNGRCRVHGTKEYPRACAEFPRTPADLADVAEQCSYHFVESDDGPMRTRAATGRPPLRDLET